MMSKKFLRLLFFCLSRKIANQPLYIAICSALVWTFPATAEKKSAASKEVIFEFVDISEEGASWHSEYTSVEDFIDGLARVKKNDLYGFVNEAGEAVIEPKFKRVGCCFLLGLTGFKSDNDKWGYIDKKGNVVIEPQFDNIELFDWDSGLAVVMVNQKKGYINTQGEFVIPPQFDHARNFSEDLALTFNMVGEGLNDYRPQYAYINKKGEVVINTDDNVTTAMNFNSGLAAVQVDGDKWGYIDKKGDWAIKPQFDEARSFSTDGTARVILNGKQRRIRLKE